MPAQRTVQRQNITYLLKGMYREGANNAVKNVQDGTLHMKEQNTIVNLSSSQDLSQCLFECELQLGQ